MEKTQRPSLDLALVLAALLAACVPTLTAYAKAPSATAFGQCLAVAMWGLVAALTSTSVNTPRKLVAQLGPLLGAMGLIAAAALGSWAFGSLPLSLALAALGLLAGAALLALSGASAARGPDGSAAFAALATGLLVAGLASSAVGLIQVFAPDWMDGVWIGKSPYIGRAVGNLRQPNQLSTLLVWALIAAVALHEMRWLSRAALWALAIPLVWVVQLSASRTGAIGLLMLLAWALLDRRLSRGARWLMGATPLLYGLAIGAMTWFDKFSGQGAGDRAKLSVAADGTLNLGDVGARLSIWRDTIDLIAAQPWTGVGFGEFNLAWTLTPFPNRSSLFFDNCHNLLLQLAVEVGLPGTFLISVLLLLALWQGLRRARLAGGDASLAARAGLMLVLVVGVHSMVEFPLWYAYFLMPAALAWGFALGAPTPEVPNIQQLTPRESKPLSARWGLAAGLLMSLGGAWSLLEYQRVTLIFANAYPVAEMGARIAEGQRSLFFAHQADYTAALGVGNSQASKELGFARGVHMLVDPKMLLAWARHLAAQGRVDEARWLLQRMREFRLPDVEAYFAPCRDNSNPPFQCQAPLAVHDWREFVAQVPAAPIASAISASAASR